jgi:hypothetical protein
MFNKPSETFPPLMNALAAFSMDILIAAALFTVATVIQHLKLTFIADKPPTPSTAYQEILVDAKASTEYFS